MAQLIPHRIPIHRASLEYHLYQPVDDLIHLLQHKVNVLTPNNQQSAKSVLLDIEKLLYHDATPSLTPTLIYPKVPYSEGVTTQLSSDISPLVASFEGGDNINLVVQ